MLLQSSTQTPSNGLRHPSFNHCPFSYAIGSRKLSANEQFFCWCSDSSKFVTNNSNKTRPGGCVSCSRACFGARSLPQSYQYPNLSKGADRVGGQLRGDKECPFSGVTISGRVWRRVPESDARSAISTRTIRRALTASLDNCVEIKSAPSVTKRNLAEFGGRCRKAMLGVWRSVSAREQRIARYNKSNHNNKN